jgi:rhodanese-related sulfurtransferase
MKKRLFVGALLIFFMVGGCTIFAKAVDPPRMTKQDLKAKLGNPDLILIDVRYGRDWTDSHLKVKGAIREDPEAIESWANKYPKDKTLVFYCA